MALADREGNTHSHLNNLDRGDSYSKILSQQPDRGTWVGPRPGETHEQHAEAARDVERTAAQEWADKVKVRVSHNRYLDQMRTEAFERLEYLIEHLPTTAHQRRVLVQALGVLMER